MMGINDLNPILQHVYGEWKFIDQHGWRVEFIQWWDWQSEIYGATWLAYPTMDM
jgi:hypothetical protein